MQVNQLITIAKTGSPISMNLYLTYQGTIRMTLISLIATKDRGMGLQMKVRTKNERKSMERSASIKKTRRIKRKRTRKIARRLKKSYLISSQSFLRNLLKKLKMNLLLDRSV